MKLLVLTSEYPNPNSTYDTPVVHYYVKEWIAAGHQVRVVHSRSVFPAAFYVVARLLTTVVKKAFKTDFIPFHRLKGTVTYRHDGVDVLSLPIFKLFPHLRYLKRTVRRHAERIQRANDAVGFTPDMLVCHFVNPQLPLIGELKRRYPAARASLVVHEDPLVIGKLFGREAARLLGTVDHIGFRYREMRDRFVRAHGERDGLFLCPSGVPARYVLDAVPAEKFTAPRLSFCFAGMLIPLKNVDVLLEALAEAFPAGEFTLRIVGDGLLRNDLEALVRRLGLSASVTFEGYRSREDVQHVLAASDVFVMVSKPEAFGLVYLEAMAKGCLVIGTRGQGIDGVIREGENGFLCEARDVAGLRDTLRAIQRRSVAEKRAVAERARQTAAALTDGAVAAAYLEQLGIH